MKLLNAAQIREWDQYTITHEPISPWELMERAAIACSKWLLQNTLSDMYYIFCGKGNNGGDGLAIARHLCEAGRKVNVFILASGAGGTKDYLTNFNLLQQQAKTTIAFIRSENDLLDVPTGTIIIDALFGTGLNRKLEGFTAALVKHINSCRQLIIAIDMPSGLFCDASSKGNIVIDAKHTLTFQCLKMAFLIPENESFFGQVHIMDINLHPDFMEKLESINYLSSASFCRQLYKSRNSFANKGNFGHALLISGSFGKAGAAVLCTMACFKSGCGLVTVHTPRKNIPVLQVAIPEAMAIADAENEFLTALSYDINSFSAVGIGPGIGKEAKTVSLLKDMLPKINVPLVIDADALNIMAADPQLLRHLPSLSILTPHPKEFTRLFGETVSDFEKISLARAKAKEHHIIIVLKGHHTFIATPYSNGYFNITGNAGMAKGGSGDALTGIITSLLAQHYSPENAAIFGVFIHGLAGDIAASSLAMESMTATDLINNLSAAFLQMQ